MSLSGLGSTGGALLAGCKLLCVHVHVCTVVCVRLLRCANNVSFRG